jgi:hypothetical protein
MAYVKQNWETGELITSQKLNHMEDGIAEGGGGVMYAHYVYDDTVDYIDKTYSELKEAYLSGMNIVCVRDDSNDDPEYGSSSFQYGGLVSLHEDVGTGSQYQSSSYTVLFSNIGGFSSTADDVNMEAME